MGAALPEIGLWSEPACLHHFGFARVGARGPVWSGTPQARGSNGNRLAPEVKMGELRFGEDSPCGRYLGLERLGPALNGNGIEPLWTRRDPSFW